MLSNKDIDIWVQTGIGEDSQAQRDLYRCFFSLDFGTSVLPHGFVLFDLESANRFDARNRGSLGQRSRFGLRADASRLKVRQGKARQLRVVDKHLMN